MSMSYLCFCHMTLTSSVCLDLHSIFILSLRKSYLCYSIMTRAQWHCTCICNSLAVSASNPYEMRPWLRSERGTCWGRITEDIPREWKAGNRQLCPWRLFKDAFEVSSRFRIAASNVWVLPAHPASFLLPLIFNAAMSMAWFIVKTKWSEICKQGIVSWILHPSSIVRGY